MIERQSGALLRTESAVGPDDPRPSRARLPSCQTAIEIRLFWGSHEVSAIPVASGRDTAFALAFARNSTSHKAKVDQVPRSPDIVEWSITYEYQIDFGVTTNLTQLENDPGEPPELTLLDDSPVMRIDRDDLAELSYRYEFGYAAIRESESPPGDPLETAVFAFDLFLDPEAGLQISGDLYPGSPLVSMDPDVEGDGVDWIEIDGSFVSTFTISGSVERDPWPGGGVDVWFDTYSRASGDLEIVPEPATLSLLVLGGLMLTRRRRRFVR